MMKNSTFIKSLFLLLCIIAGGIGSAWAEKITDYNDIVSGKKYYIGATVSETDYYFYAYADYIGSGIQGTSKANKAEASVLIFEGSGDSWSIKFVESGYYLSLASSKANGKVNVVEDAVNWTASNVSGLIQLKINGYLLQKNSGTSLNFGSYASGQKNVWLEEYVEATELEASDLALTDAPIALNFDLYNNASAQVINYTTSSTGAVTIDDSDYATFAIDEVNKTITVTPTAKTSGAETITINQEADETYNAGSVTFTITIDDSTPVPTHTATFSVNGVTSTQVFEEGADIEFPENPADVSGKTFVGWVTETIDGTTNEAPTFVTSATMGESDIIYYAVFAYASGSGSADVVDELNRELTEVSGTNYASWTGKTATSTAVYAGNSAGGNNAIQLRSNNSNSGIVTTASGGKVKKVVITWDSNTTATRTVSIYGKNSAYSAASDLYSSATQGTLLGELNIDNASELTSELTISDDYEYIGIRSKSGALYLDEVQITWSTGGGVSYSDYCTTVVAATVARPTITVEENPFMFSTTATITCETEGASIKYSFDGENWNNYEGALTITETKTLYAKAVKDADESTVASVEITKNLAVPTVTIDATGITNTNVFDGTDAGTLAATVTYNDAAVEGAEVTWSADNDEVATIDASTGAITLVGAGSVTFTATYAGNDDYSEKTATYEMTVTNSDPNAPGTENNPYTVAQALENTPASGTSANVYIRGIVSAFYGENTDITGDNAHRYYVSDDGTTTNQLLVYNGKGLNNVAFSAAEDLQIGDVVVILGGLTTYNSTKEVAKDNYIVSLARKPAAPEFSIAEGEYASAQTVELTAAEGATIYYTLDGNDPTTESSVYSVALVIEQTTTVKAIAVKDDMSSDVATATYTINTTPFITVAQTAVNVEAAGADGIIEVTYNNMPQDEFLAEVVYCDAEGNDATYDWLAAEINDESNNIDYVISENTSTEARTAYIKVYALYDDDYFSDIITFTQAGMVVDWATLPFEYNDGRAYLPTGLTESGLGTDYNGSTAPNTRLKFDNTSDELVLKINEAATVLTFNMKGNGFSGGTFKVQTSANGTDYDDLETYQELSESQEKFLLDANVRYIKWVYTEKRSGNVGLGKIKVEKRMGDATVTLAATCNDGEGNYYGTYSNATGFIVPEGLTVSEIGIDSENKLDVQEYATGDIVPANTGVMVSSTVAGAHDIVLSTGGESVLGSSNRLRATSDSEKTATAMNDEDSDCVFYRLTMHNGSDLGFWWGAENGAAFSVAANKAYLAVPKSEQTARIQGFSFDDGIVTGIANMNREAIINNGSVYNMKGQRVAQPAKGLYIQNGKKVVVK